MRASGGRRVEWHELPPAVRGSVERAVGAAVIGARNQVGGFSPGLAARCDLADGRRVFVKAVSPDQNPLSARIHRREAEVASRLPPELPVPRLRHVLDDGHWVVLVFDHVEGRQPDEPWTLEDLDVVVPAVVEMGRSTTPSPVTDLASVVDKHGTVFAGWRRLAEGEDGTGLLPVWAREHLDLLVGLETGWEEAATGDTLLHADLRADNVLISHDGTVVFVDWPWGCVGRAFVDLLFMLPSVGLGSGPAPADVVARYDLFTDVDEGELLAVLAAFTGFLLRESLQPPPPGIPALRRFQAAQGEVALGWLRGLL